MIPLVSRLSMSGDNRLPIGDPSACCLSHKKCVAAWNLNGVAIKAVRARAWRARGAEWTLPHKKRK